MFLNPSMCKNTLSMHKNTFYMTCRTPLAFDFHVASLPVCSSSSWRFFLLSICIRIRPRQSLQIDGDFWGYMPIYRWKLIGTRNTAGFSRPQSCFCESRGKNEIRCRTRSMYLHIFNTWNNSQHKSRSDGTFLFFDVVSKNKFKFRVLNELRISCILFDCRISLWTLWNPVYMECPTNVTSTELY